MLYGVSVWTKPAKFALSLAVYFATIMLFVRYLPGAFDAATGLSHAWKQTPRVELFGVEYLGPNQVLRRVER